MAIGRGISVLPSGRAAVTAYVKLSGHHSDTEEATVLRSVSK